MNRQTLSRHLKAKLTAEQQKLRNDPEIYSDSTQRKHKQIKEIQQTRSKRKQRSKRDFKHANTIQIKPVKTRTSSSEQAANENKRKQTRIKQTRQLRIIRNSTRTITVNNSKEELSEEQQFNHRSINLNIRVATRCELGAEKENETTKLNDTASTAKTAAQTSNNVTKLRKLNTSRRRLRTQEFGSNSTAILGKDDQLVKQNKTENEIKTSSSNQPSNILITN